MASYTAVIDLIVKGEAKLRTLRDELEGLTKALNKISQNVGISDAQLGTYKQVVGNLKEAVVQQDKLLKQKEDSIVKQSRLNAAVDLYERRLKQTSTSGAASLKKFEKQIKEIENAFKFFKDKGSVVGVQALATELGRMVEYANEINRNERARATAQSKLLSYASQLTAYQEKGLNISAAQEKFDKLKEVTGSNKINQVKKYTEALDRQLKLLAEEAKATAEVQAQIVRLNAAQADFIERTNAGAAAARRQTAEFYRMQRIAKEVAELNRTAPPAQRLLAPAAPGSPAMGGGARSLITGPVERLGGARTADEAAMALRYAQGLKEQVRPLSQIQALYGGIYQEASKLQKVKALPDTEMLNAAVRGIKQLETAEDRLNRERQESAERLQLLDRLEESRARRARKLKDIASYLNEKVPTGTAPPLPPRAKGMFDVPQAGQRPGIRPGSLAFNPNPTQENLALGAGFPLLFGGGPAQVAGGLLGSMFGGGFGGQILGAAIGQQLTDAFVRITDIGKALDTLNMDKLRDSVITVNSALDYQIGILIQAGKAEEARALAARAVFEQTGLTAGAVERATNVSNQLKNAWDGVIGAISGTLTVVVNVLAPTFIGILKVVEALFKGINAIVTVLGDAGAAAGKWALELVFGKDVAEQIYNFFKGTNEEEEKLTAELARSVDEQKRGLELSKKLLAIDKTRTSDTSTRGKLINIEADKQEKLARVLFDFDEKRRKIQEQYGAIKTAEGKKLLAESLALNEAEKDLAIESAKLTAERQKQLALSKKIAEEDNSSVTALKAQQRAIASQVETWGAIGSIVSARIGAEQQLNGLQKVRLERDYENAKTAQKRYEISLALFRNEVVGAQLEYQNTLASIALEGEKLKLQQSMAVLKGYEILAEGKLQILKADSVEEETKKRQQVEEAVAAQNRVIQGLGTQITAQQAIGKYQAEGATAAYKTRIETAGLALQQKLASDAIGLSADKAKLIAGNMINAYTSTSTLTGITDNLAVKMNDAAVAIGTGAQNVTQISTASLGAANSTDVWRQAILDKEAATNKAFQEEYKAIQDNLKQKQAAYAAAVAAAKGADSEAVKSTRFSADAIRSSWALLVGQIQGLYSGFLRGLLGGINSAIRAINSVISSYNSLPTPPFPNVRQLGYLQIPGYAEGGLVMNPTLAMVGEGGEPEYIIPQSKMATAASNYLAGGRGAGILEGGGSAADPVINVQTGPVMEMNGERYVTMGDFERGLRQVAGSVYKGLRTPAGRYATGVR